MVLDDEKRGFRPYIPIGRLAANPVLATLSPLPLVTSPNQYRAAH